MLILKDFKFFVLELHIVKDLEVDFSELQIPKGLASWRATVTCDYITKSNISQVGTEGVPREGHNQVQLRTVSCELSASFKANWPHAAITSRPREYRVNAGTSFSSRMR